MPQRLPLAQPAYHIVTVVCVSIVLRQRQKEGKGWGGWTKKELMVGLDVLLKSNPNPSAIRTTAIPYLCGEFL